MKTLENIKLTQQEQRSILLAAGSLKSELPVSRVVLFGSKARGTADFESDIDLLVLITQPVTANLRTKISEQLAEINLEYDVAMTSIVVSEKEWSDGLIHHTLIHSEVERDGCEV